MGVQLVTAISELDWNEIVSLFSDLNVCAYVLYIICIRMCVCVCMCEGGDGERGSECSLQ